MGGDVKQLLSRLQQLNYCIRMLMMLLVPTNLQKERALSVCVPGFRRQAVHVASGEAL